MSLISIQNLPPYIPSLSNPLFLLILYLGLQMAFWLFTGPKNPDKSEGVRSGQGQKFIGLPCDYARVQI